MLILIHNRAEAEESEVQRHLDHCSRKSERFFATIEEIIAQEQSRKAYVSIQYIFFDFSHDISCRMSDSLPSATKILQPVDVHIGSTGKYTFGSENFHSKSGILHEARALQDRYSSLFFFLFLCPNNTISATRRYWKYFPEDRIHSIGIWHVERVLWQIPPAVRTVVVLG